MNADSFEFKVSFGNHMEQQKHKYSFLFVYCKRKKGPFLYAATW